MTKTTPPPPHDILSMQNNVTTQLLQKNIRRSRGNQGNEKKVLLCLYIIAFLIAPTTIEPSSRRPVVILWSAIGTPASVPTAPSRGRAVHVGWRWWCRGSIGRVIWPSVRRVVTIGPVDMCVCVCDNKMLKLNTIHTKCYHVSDMSWVQLKDPRMCFVMVMLLWHEMTITILSRGRRWGYLSCSLLTPHHLSRGRRWGYLSCSLLTPHHLSRGRR